MNKRICKITSVSASVSNRSLWGWTIVCSAFMLSGILAGYFASGSACAETSTGMPPFNLFILQIINGEFSSADFGSILARSAYPMFAVMLLGTSIPGFALTPFLLAAKGFSLAFAATIITAAAEKNRWLLMIVSLGITNLVAIPCLLIISVLSCCFSHSLFDQVVRGRTKNEAGEGRIYCIRCVALVTAIVCASVVETLAMPKIARILLSI